MAERSIGRAVRLWRKERDLSLAEAAELFGFATGTISMIENAIRPTDPEEVIALGLAYRVKGEVRKPIAKRAAREAARRERERSQVSSRDAWDDLSDVCGEVSVVRAYGGSSIPSLPHSWIDRIDSDDPLRMEIVATEDAVRQAPRENLLNLVRLAEHEHLDVRVHAGQRGAESSFLLLSFAHRYYSDVVFVEQAGVGSYVEDPMVCQLVRQSFLALQRSALGPQESVDFIAEVAEGGRE